MPTSTQKGFSVGKWELYYQRGRYKSHRNKVAAAQPAIDSKPPAERPHVYYKRKKGLNETQRQTLIMIENLRILNKTCEIMSGSDYNYYHNFRANDVIHGEYAKSAKSKKTMGLPKISENISNSSPSSSSTSEESGQNQRNKLKVNTTGYRKSGQGIGAQTDFHQQHLRQRQSQPITLVTKKNTHIMLSWFLRRFGKYVPWWAQVTY